MTTKQNVFTDCWIHFTSHFDSKTEKKIAENKKEFNPLNSKRPKDIATGSH
jgi:hypothetical protein